jgi:pyruvate formate lyase activating enzyme
MERLREELRGIAGFLASVSPDIPWHVTAYHRDYKMRDHADTTPGELVRAAQWGKEAGLRYVYAGNRPGRVGALENTCCPKCGTVVVERTGYTVLSKALTDEGRCPTCRTASPASGRAPWCTRRLTCGRRRRSFTAR